MIKLLNWFRRGALERRLDRELQYHFDRRVADLASAGISEPEFFERSTGARGTLSFQRLL
jgi:hypothetical protein